jgi:Transcriptional regulator, AbiEi antitoxin
MREAGRESPVWRNLLDQAPVDVAIAAIAAVQHTLVTVDQLRTLGLSSSTISRRVASGRLHRLYRGVYSLVPPNLLIAQGHYLAAVLACGPGAVLSHRSAAALHGLLPTARANVDVTVPARSAREQPGTDVHRSTTLIERDVTVVDNIPVTTVARTLLDLAEVIPRRALERAYDQADAACVFNLRALGDQLERNSTRPAAKVVRELLAEHYVGSTLTRSELEERVVVHCRKAGLPTPAVNELLVLPDGGVPIRVDFLFRAARVALETDGYRTHRTRRQFELDRDNDMRLTACSSKPVRTTWLQIERRTQIVIARLVQIIRPPARGPRPIQTAG